MTPTTGAAAGRGGRRPADARLRRLLALVPWVAARDGPRVEEVCARFACTEDELVEDLGLLFLCGLHPYTPDVLIDVDVAGGRVWIRYADYFSRPLRLTPDEGFALLAAGRALLDVPGSDPEGPLARALAKLAHVLGVDHGEAVDVTLGPAAQDVMQRLTQAGSDRRQVEIEYYAYGRDRWTRRVVDPWAVYSDSGNWYLHAYCHLVDDERLFRVDRVRSVAVLDSSFERSPQQPETAVYHPRPEDPRVTLELGPGSRWVVEQYPVEHVRELGGARLEVRLAASARPWLERLLLRLGPDARVVEGDAAVGPAAARRLLARYRQGDPKGALQGVQ